MTGPFHLNLAIAVAVSAGVLAALYIDDASAAIHFALTLVVAVLAKGAYVTPADPDDDY